MRDVLLRYLLPFFLRNKTWQKYVRRETPIASTLFTFLFPFPLQSCPEFGFDVGYYSVFLYILLHMLHICKQTCFNTNWYHIESHHLQLGFLVQYFVSFVFLNNCGFNSFICYCCVVFHCMNISQLTYPFSYWTFKVLLQMILPLTFLVCVSWYMCVIISLGYNI